MRLVIALVLLLLAPLAPVTAAAQSAPRAASGQKWVAAWVGSIQGPYPIGNPSAQPEMKLAFPSDEAGARDQSFRMILKPEIWGREARLRFSNVLGTKPVTFDGVYIGLHLTSSALVQGTNRPVTFGGKRSVTVAAGDSAWSDAVALPFVRDPGSAELAGRKLAVSFHVAGESGPMTWHAKALQTSYLSMPGVGAKGADEGEAVFLISTTSWYFIDALDMKMPGDAGAIVAFGDSITDGTLSTLNGDDRWPDVLARRLRAALGNRIAVVNAGIGGNQVVGPKDYSPRAPFPGGPSAVSRLERDVLSLSGVTAVIWLEGINDFSKNGNATVEMVQAGNEGERRPHPRTDSRCPRDRRDLDARARRQQSQPRLPRARREAQGAQRIHPHERRVRRRRRFRQGHHRSGHRRDATAVRAQHDRRRGRRQPASEPARLHRHGHGDRSRPGGAGAGKGRQAMNDRAERAPRVEPVATPYPAELQKVLDAIMPPGVPPLTLFTTLARVPRIWDRFRAGSLLDRGPALAPPPRDRDRPHLRALRLRLRMGCARRVLRSARGADARTAPRDGARRFD
jgi:hypothetical protein